MLATWVNDQIIVNGLVRGMVYGLVAMSIVLIYRSTKVINFAAGSMGLVSSGLLVILSNNYGVPFWLAALVAVAAGVVYGVIIETAVIRRLFKAPRVIVLVATIGVSQVSEAILLGLPDVEHPRVPYPLAIGGQLEVREAVIKGSQQAVFIATPLLALALGWFLTRTLTGRTVRAAASNADLGRLYGINPKARSTMVWAIGGFISAVSMILIGGVSGNAAQLGSLGPSSMLRALVAALIARFTSFRVALVAAVLIGMTEELFRFNFLDNPGLIDVVLLVVVLVSVGTLARERIAGDAVYSFTPKVEQIPERLKSIFWLRNLDRLVLMVPLALVAVLPLIVTLPSRQLLYASISAFAICALSVTVLTGWAGQLSLGQMAFAGIGAYLAAAFTRGLIIDWTVFGFNLYLRMNPIPFAASMFVAALVTAGLAALVGAGALRVRGLLLAVSTFALVIAAVAWIYRQDVFTGGHTGAVPFPRGSLFGIDLGVQRNYYYFVVTILVLAVALLGRLRRSGVGRVTVAVRDNPITAAGYTVRPAMAKMRAFALSGGLAGLGGALLAGVGSSIKPDDWRYSITGSIMAVSMVVIGGMGSVMGAVVGSIWVVGLPALAPDNEIIPLLTSSIGLLVLLLYFPGGFADIAYRTRAMIYRRLERDLPPLEKVTTSAAVVRSTTARPAVTQDVPLRATDVSVSFGGVRANDHVTLEVRKDEVVGLIGTNGAGKTTLMNAIGGYVPARGRVELLGVDISHESAASRARHGLGRTFQAATLFPELTVRETVMVALEARGRSGLIETALFSPRARARSRAQRSQAAELVHFLGLGRYADRQISELSTGTRRIVELAGLLALDARVLCLDEPTAGIAQREAEAMGPLLLEIRKELGASMLVIEHDMPLIMSLSDRVYCMELGRVISVGTPQEVRNDPAVIASYLGMDERMIKRSNSTADVPPTA